MDTMRLRFHDPLEWERHLLREVARGRGMTRFINELETEAWLRVAIVNRGDIPITDKEPFRSTTLLSESMAEVTLSHYAKPLPRFWDRRGKVFFKRKDGGRKIKWRFSHVAA